MKVILVAILISAGCSQAFLAAQNAPASGAVEGTVVNSVTGAGIGGADVELSPNRITQYHTTTDVTGHFRITGVPSGSYLIGARKEGFGSSTSDTGFFSNSGLHVASGGDPVKVELKLTPTGTMSGRVLGPDGKPAAGVEVSVYQWLMAEAPVTDKDGRFAFENVAPGSYTLVARPPPSAQPEQASDGTRTAMVTTYYPSVADLSLAQPVVFHGRRRSKRLRDPVAKPLGCTACEGSCWMKRGNHLPRLCWICSGLLTPARPGPYRWRIVRKALPSLRWACGHDTAAPRQP